MGLWSYKVSDAFEGFLNVLCYLLQPCENPNCVVLFPSKYV